MSHDQIVRVERSVTRPYMVTNGCLKMNAAESLDKEIPKVSTKHSYRFLLYNIPY